MTETFNALTVIGDKITQEDHVVHLLASLSDTYCMLVKATGGAQDGNGDQMAPTWGT